MLYLLKDSGRVGWDETGAMVIRASSEAEARLVGSAKGEGKAWEGQVGITLELLSADGPSEVICEDCNQG